MNNWKNDTFKFKLSDSNGYNLEIYIKPRSHIRGVSKINISISYKSFHDMKSLNTCIVKILMNNYSKNIPSIQIDQRYNCGMNQENLDYAITLKTQYTTRNNSINVMKCVLVSLFIGFTIIFMLF